MEVAVPVVGDLLHLGVLQIPRPEAHDGEKGPSVALLLDQAHHLGVARGAHVEVTVGGQDHPVVPVLHEVLERRGVREFEPGPPRRAAPGLEFVERGHDLVVPVARGRRQHQPRSARVDHDRDPVLGPQLVHQQREGLLEQGQLVVRPHRPGDVEQEDQVAGRQVFGVDRTGVQPDAHQAVFLSPGRVPHLGGDGEGVLSSHGVPVVGEVVDHLLDAHRVDRRPLAVLDEAADVGVGRPVHVDGEGGERGRADEPEVVFGDVGVGFGVEVGRPKVEGRDLDVRHGVGHLPGCFPYYARFGHRPDDRRPAQQFLRDFVPVRAPKLKIDHRRPAPCNRDLPPLRLVAQQLGHDHQAARRYLRQGIAAILAGACTNAGPLHRDPRDGDRLAGDGVGDLAPYAARLRICG